MLFLNKYTERFSENFDKINKSSVVKLEKINDEHCVYKT